MYNMIFKYEDMKYFYGLYVSTGNLNTFVHEILKSEFAEHITIYDKFARKRR